MVQIIDGLAYAKKLKHLIQLEIEENRDIGVPRLAVVQVAEYPASQLYVAAKIKQAKNIGIDVQHHHLEEDIKQEKIIELIRSLNEDASINGIIVQLPLPQHLDPDRIIDSIDPIKDVDGLTYTNAGLLMKGIEGVIPCTPLGCMLLLKTLVQDFSGLNAVVVGCSNLVGKPMAQLLLRHDCTVTSIHRESRNPEFFTSKADILIVAAGHAGLVKRNWVKEGAIVLDVGLNRIEDEPITGDTDFEAIKDKVAAISPVPGGVGPMTVACLLLNTTIAMLKQSARPLMHLAPFSGTGIPCL